MSDDREREHCESVAGEWVDSVSMSHRIYGYETIVAGLADLIATERHSAATEGRARAEKAEAERDAMRTKLEALEAVQYDLMRERDEARARLRVLEEAAREAHRLLRVSLSTDVVDRIGVSMAATDLWRALGSLPSQGP